MRPHLAGRRWRSFSGSACLRTRPTTAPPNVIAATQNASANGPILPPQTTGNGSIAPRRRPSIPSRRA